MASKKAAAVTATARTVLQLLDEVQAGQNLAQHLLEAFAVEQLGRLAALNHWWYLAVTQAHPVWGARCDELWAGKVHVCAQAVAVRSRDPRSALRLSLGDSTRTRLTEEELTSFRWSFRFKEEAGPSWFEHDPYWNEKPAANVSFFADGGARIGGFEGLDRVPLRWTWGRKGAQGSTVQLHVNGRPVPTYIVSRHAPNWGFLMQSCWALYTSWPMPARGCDAALEDSALAIRVRDQVLEAQRYNLGVVAESDSDSDVEFQGGGGEGDENTVVTVQLPNGSMPYDVLRLMMSTAVDDSDDDADDDGDDVEDVEDDQVEQPAAANTRGQDETDRDG